MNSLAWLAGQTAVFHPLWSMLHITGVVWGLWLIWQAKQPLWINRFGEKIWRSLSHKPQRNPGHLWSPLWLGMVWALLPCGLLYSALLVAMFTSGALQGALVMVMFALGGGLVLTVVPWLWSLWGNSKHSHPIRWRKTSGSHTAWQNEHLGTRVSGFLLTVTATAGLWSVLTQKNSPWCLPNGWM